MKDILERFTDKDGQIVFEYAIPRLGKRVNVVLLLDGSIFCVEFKVGESRILESDIDQVLDYALDLMNLLYTPIVQFVLLCRHFRLF